MERGKTNINSTKLDIEPHRTHFYYANYNIMQYFTCFAFVYTESEHLN